MERVSAGDASALDELLTRYWSALVAYAARYVSDPDAAEDVAQEVFVRVWKRRADWTPTGSVRGYLYRIARNLALNEKRRRATRTDWAEKARRRQPRRSPTPLQDAEAGELEAAAERAIEALPDRRREVFTLSRFEGLSYSEIADALEISPQTVANQMSAALSALRESLAPHIEEPAVPAASSPRS